MKLSAMLILTAALSAIAAPPPHDDSIQKRANFKPTLMDAGADSDFTEKRTGPSPPLASPPLVDAGIDFGFTKKRVSAKPPLMDAGVDFGTAEKRASPKNP